MNDATAESCAKALLSGWIARFGVPVTIISDQGRQFESSLWREIMNLLGITQHQTTAYYPQANGMVERFHRHFKGALKARLAGNNWANELPIVLLGIRATLKEDLSCTSAELVYGTTLRLPGDFFSSPTLVDPSSFVSKLRQTMNSQRFIPTEWHSSPTSHVPSDLNSASHVYVRRDGYKPPLTRPYLGPFPVISRAPKHFTVDMNGKETTISLDRLKPAKIESASRNEPSPQDDTPPPQSPHQEQPVPKPVSTRSGRSVRTPTHFTDYATNW